MSTGFFQLILDQNSVKPQTFDMDWDRLSNLNKELNYATTVASMLAGLAADSNSFLRSGKSTSDDREQHLHNCAVVTLGIVKSVGEKIKECNFANIVEVLIFLRFFF